MPHQCVHCGRIIPAGSKELLEGCTKCKSHFFFYIRDEQLERVKDQLVEIPKEDKKQVEKDIREIAGIVEEKAPVILDIESVRVTGPGKFEIDIVNLFRKDRPLIYKLEEGKYIIDLASTLRKSMKDVPEIRDPGKIEDREEILEYTKDALERLEDKTEDEIEEVEEKVEEKVDREIKEQVEKDIREKEEKKGLE
jgi:predicted  nucleic acid-binding Zn-ribbon protein